MFLVVKLAYQNRSRALLFGLSLSELSPVFFYQISPLLLSYSFNLSCLLLIIRSFHLFLVRKPHISLQHRHWRVVFKSSKLRHDDKALATDKVAGLIAEAPTKLVRQEIAGYFPHDWLSGAQIWTPCGPDGYPQTLRELSFCHLILDFKKLYVLDNPNATVAYITSPMSIATQNPPYLLYLLNYQVLQHISSLNPSMHSERYPASVVSLFIVRIIAFIGTRNKFMDKLSIKR